MKYGRIFAEALAGGDLTLGPQVALVVFAAFMTLVYAWIMRPRAAQTYAALSQSALDDGG